MKKTNKRSKSLIIAQLKYEEKRKLKPRLPATCLSDKESEIFKRALKITGKNKKDTILYGLSLISYMRGCDTCKNQDFFSFSEIMVCSNCIDFNNWELRE